MRGALSNSILLMVLAVPAQAQQLAAAASTERVVVYGALPDSDIGVSAAKVRFEIGPIVLTSKLIDGSFPDYQRVIPQGNDKKMRVSNAQFMSAVDRVSTIASERGRAVKLNIAKDKLILSVTNPDGGSATEELPIEYGAGNLEIGFNARYLLDIGGQLESDTMQFLLADSGSPTMVRDGGDERALYVLMPMRV